MPDPEPALVATSELTRVSDALRIIDTHADLGERYRTMLHDCLATLGATHIRHTQARGIAKKLVVLARAPGTEPLAAIGEADHDALTLGLADANELIRLGN